MTEIMGVFGYPIKHSMSPEMHTAAFKQLGLDMAYHAFEVHPEFLEKAINGIRGLGLKGVNVTIPHKVAVLQYLDMVDDLALEIGAVNTIVNMNGQLTGYNTDGEGYLQSLLPFIKSDIKQMHVLIIGAGGAARAVAITLAKYGVRKITIANRTAAKATELALQCSKFCQSKDVSMEEAEKHLSDYDLLINTTSIGMTPHISQVPLSLDELRSETYVSDLIYTPLKTQWLSIAEKKGAPVLNGLGMFVQQGALAFERWTGKKAPAEVMKQAVLRRLNEG
ncbi:shikimate dehydrogenase [Evansella caseinilytica]|uniref:Shikimate dehydrogenase (NADP(+)) n=1 Tax=Evansella caseinilytica TaxID=1503961 RepID=A0A1H3KEG8_9BACI|nr:shikimate dehydrogenase [Evansella caseinilytica]SDY50513.1 shikimate dehydrogenase [Evansella caseinilytica]